MIFSVLLAGVAAAEFGYTQGFYSDAGCTTALASDNVLCSGVSSQCAAIESSPGIASCSAANCGLTITYEDSVTAADTCKAAEGLSQGCQNMGTMYMKQTFNCGSEDKPEDKPENEPEEGGDDKKDDKTDGGKTDDGKTDDKTDDTKDTKDADDGEKDGAAALSMIVALVTPFLAML